MAARKSRKSVRVRACRSNSAARGFSRSISSRLTARISSSRFICDVTQASCLFHFVILTQAFCLLKLKNIPTEDNEENKNLTHETRQIRERVWVNRNSFLNLGVFSRPPRRSRAKAGV